MSTILERMQYGSDRDSRQIWRPLEERKDDEGTPAVQYYWGARHRDDLVRRDRATTDGGDPDETRYVLMDYYSPAAITDKFGTVTERYAFSAFGVRQILAPDFTPRTDSECSFEFAFQGQFLDIESGFMDYGYRYYSPWLGRWVSKDPIEESGGTNLYMYAVNAPVNYVDYLGLFTQEELRQHLVQGGKDCEMLSKANPVKDPKVGASFYAEYCGQVCCKKGVLRNSQPGTDNKRNGCNFYDHGCNDDEVAVGNFHNHPIGTLRPLSPQDRYISDKTHIPISATSKNQDSGYTTFGYDPKPDAPDPGPIVPGPNGFYPGTGSPWRMASN